MVRTSLWHLYLPTKHCLDVSFALSESNLNSETRQGSGKADHAPLTAQKAESIVINTQRTSH